MVGTRRAVLVAAPAVLLSACGSSGSGDQADPNVDLGTQKEGDAALLEGLLEVEAREVARYAALARDLTGDRRALARELAGQEREHVAALKAAYRGVAKRDAPAIAAADDTGAGLRSALAGEGTTYATYLDFIPKFADGDLRKVVVSIAAAEAAHMARLRMALGETPVPEAFVT